MFPRREPQGSYARKALLQACGAFACELCLYCSMYMSEYIGGWRGWGKPMLGQQNIEAPLAAYILTGKTSR